jgi:hypothetical protein
MHGGEVNYKIDCRMIQTPLFSLVQIKKDYIVLAHTPNGVGTVNRM